MAYLTNVVFFCADVNAIHVGASWHRRRPVADKSGAGG